MATEFVYRPATQDELVDLDKVLAYAFANNSEEEPKPATLIPEWTLCAFDGDKMAATSGAFPFKMRFNGAAISAAGITAVGTDPGYRRQGLVRNLMTQWLHKSHADKVPVAILWASMGAIYQRFGYGLASTQVTYKVDPRFAGFQFGDAPTGRIERMTKQDALPILRNVYRSYSSDRNLMLHRAPQLWDAMLPDKGPPVHIAVHFEDDIPRGYCIYGTKNTESVQVGPWQEMNVTDFCYLDINAYRYLWQYLCSHDLVFQINRYNVPEDDPAPGILLEPRMLQRRTGDGIWMRIIDLETTLSTRPYNSHGRIYLGLDDDDLCPWNNGVYQLEADGCSCEVTRLKENSQQDIRATINGLASLLSGHSSVSFLNQIGRISVEDPSRLSEFDAFFATRYPPNCPNGF